MEKMPWDFGRALVCLRHPRKLTIKKKRSILGFTLSSSVGKVVAMLHRGLIKYETQLLTRFLGPDHRIPYITWAYKVYYVSHLISKIRKVMRPWLQFSGEACICVRVKKMCLLTFCLVSMVSIYMVRFLGF